MGMRHDLKGVTDKLQFMEFRMSDTMSFNDCSHEWAISFVVVYFENGSIL
jgi:hypothetical protein